MDRSLSVLIENLIEYAKRNLELDVRNINYVRNAIYGELNVGFLPEPAEDITDKSPERLLGELVTALKESGQIEDGEEERVCDAVMGILSLTPAEIDKKFSRLVSKNSKEATDWLYSYCVKNDYVKRGKLDKNPRFDVDGLTITINKAKPEFRDAKKAKQGNAVAGGYPKCVICCENEGFAPRNKRTLRTVSIKLGGEDFFWQYSPYGYFNEHGIAVNQKHTPMYVDKTTFYKLMDFVDMFPHYFIGCNATLPRIGGSVLAHDHYQGGGEVLPLHKAKIKTYLKIDGYPSLKAGILDWGGTVVRLISTDRDEIADVCEKIRLAWVTYNNPALGIIAKDGEGIHNAISPTVVKTANGYEMNVILRSNITSKEYPDGVFHAHPEFHSIKKESIGLIEAQGLFILPGRLDEQLKKVEECIKKGELDAELEDFRLVYEETKVMGLDDVHLAMQRELGSIGNRILQNTAVFKTEEQTKEFLSKVGFYE